MDQHVEQRVVNCEDCPEGERVVVYNETHYECKAILELVKRKAIRRLAKQHAVLWKLTRSSKASRKEPKRKVPGHPAHHVLMCGCHIFIPDICPRAAAERARELCPGASNLPQG